MIKSESIELLKSKLDIVDVVGNYVELKRSGGNFVGRCPFHDEKTASFSVSPTRQFYHCFGCKAGGDAIKFVQDYERISFSDAVEKLAGEYNFALEYSQENSTKKQDLRPLEVLNELFKTSLKSQKTAYDYLISRGVNDELIRRFEIGFAGESSTQEEVLRRAKIPIPSALEVGAFVQDESGREYARFTHRITFPIKNPYGVLVGFGGRTITNHPAKYINSPQSAVFNKSRLLYAFDLAKPEIIKTKKVIVVEGYMDAIMLHLAGFTHTVATLGTALTEEHLPLLKRLDSPEVILSYDSDQAGKNAALKAAKLLSARGFRGGVALLESGKDPAELVASDQIELIKKAYRDKKPFTHFVIDSILQESESTKDEKLAKTAEFLSTLAELNREECAMYAGAMLGVDPRRFRQKRSLIKSDKRVFDLGEITLIKTLALDLALFEEFIEYLDERLFESHKDAFALISDTESSQMREILLDDSIVTLSRDELAYKIRLFLAKYYEKELVRIRQVADLDFASKSYILRKIQDVISRLKKGELVAFVETKI